MSTWQQRESRTVYENTWIRVREDDVVRPDGTPGIYGVVEVRNPAVFVVAIDDDERVCLVTVDRYTVGPSREIPAGGSDGEDLLLAAQRELREEAGIVARSWELIGTMSALNGICEAPEHVFLARDVTSAREDEAVRALTDHEQAVEGISAVEWLPWSAVLSMVASGEINDGETVAALMFAALRLGRVH